MQHPSLEIIPATDIRAKAKKPKTKSELWQTTWIREVRVHYHHTAYQSVQCAEDTAGFVRSKLADNSREHLFALFLDIRRQLIGYALLSLGTSNASLCSAADLFQRALLCGATHIILAHNHPSQNTTPSDADLQVTQNLSQAGRVIQIELLDHVIVTDAAFYSIREHHPHKFASERF